MTPHTPIVVFSNVDTVLLEPREPAFAAAGRLLRRLWPENVAVVLCSSQTRAELEFIQQMLDLCDPFICEHGAALFVPAGRFPLRIPASREVRGYQTVEFGRPYLAVVDALHQSAERLRIQIAGFSDMSIEFVARECNIPLLQARLAKLRDYEERFRLFDPDPDALNRLAKALSAFRVRVLRAEPFHYAGAPVDPLQAVTLLRSVYRRAHGDVLTIGMVDPASRSDLGSLVDYRIRVGNAAGGYDVVEWAEAIVAAVEDLRAAGTQAHAASGRQLQ
jgi:mannosyl-3-phosphoglycerate phosphatase